MQGIMKNIFLEEMSQEEFLLEELLKDQQLLKYFSERENEELVEYYRKSLESDLELMEKAESK